MSLFLVHFTFVWPLRLNDITGKKTCLECSHKTNGDDVTWIQWMTSQSNFIFVIWRHICYHSWQKLGFKFPSLEKVFDTNVLTQQHSTVHGEKWLESLSLDFFLTFLSSLLHHRIQLRNDMKSLNCKLTFYIVISQCVCVCILWVGVGVENNRFWRIFCQ